MDLFSTGMTSSAFIAGASAGAQELLANIAPVIELVCGVLVAFIVAKYLVSLFKSTDGSEHHTKSDLNMYHYSETQMEHEGIDPMGISEFDEGRF